MFVLYLYVFYDILWLDCLNWAVRWIYFTPTSSQDKEYYITSHSNRDIPNEEWPLAHILKDLHLIALISHLNYCISLCPGICMWRVTGLVKILSWNLFTMRIKFTLQHETQGHYDQVSLDLFLFSGLLPVIQSFISHSAFSLAHSILIESYYSLFKPSLGKLLL